MTTEPEAIPADVLEPCPFCGAHLERGMHNRRNRDGSFAYMCVHPDVEPRCVASSVVVWAGERESEDAWNRRASRAPVDGAGWRPIETAPKDTTEITVLCGRKDVRLGWYFAPSSRNYGWRDQNSRRIKPTHWMPLPAAPGTHPGTVDGAEAKPVAWVQQKTLDALIEMSNEASSFQIANARFAAWDVPLYTRPAPASPDAELVRNELEAVITKYAGAAKRNALEMASMPLSVVEQHFREFSDELRALLSKHGGDRA